MESLLIILRVVLLAMVLLENYLLVRWLGKVQRNSLTYLLEHFPKNSPEKRVGLVLSFLNTYYITGIAENFLFFGFFYLILLIINKVVGCNIPPSLIPTPSLW
jgi:hypothetical protein